MVPGARQSPVRKENQMKGIASFVAIGCVSLALGGCVVVTDVPPEDASGTTATRPSANGQPANMASAQSSAYWIWHSGGGRWHLRTTSGGTVHRFSGKVSGSGAAKIVRAKSVSKEHDDKVKFLTDKVNFDLNTGRSGDGFDFDVAGRCVDFEIEIDGSNQPQHIVVGSREQRPSAARFTACP
jgi:hypothetical protein